MFKIGSRVRISYYEGNALRTKAFKGKEGTITSRTICGLDDDGEFVYWHVELDEEITLAYMDNVPFTVSSEFFTEEEMEKLPENIQEQSMFKLIRKN